MEQDEPIIVTSPNEEVIDEPEHSSIETNSIATPLAAEEVIEELPNMIHIDATEEKLDDIRQQLIDTLPSYTPPSTSSSVQTKTITLDAESLMELAQVIQSVKQSKQGSNIASRLMSKVASKVASRMVSKAPSGIRTPIQPHDIIINIDNPLADLAEDTEEIVEQAEEKVEQKASEVIHEANVHMHAIKEEGKGFLHSLKHGLHFVADQGKHLLSTLTSTGSLATFLPDVKSMDGHSSINFTGANEDLGSTRNRKIDRRNLANDILAELPISIRYNENVYIDSSEQPINYTDDWEQWCINNESQGFDHLDALIEDIKENALKYKRLSNKHFYWNQVIQTSLFVLGTAIVYVQASGTTAEVVNRFNVASGVGTACATILLGVSKCAKKYPHYAKVSSNLTKLVCWLENKLILPVNKRFSPFDLYAISKIARDTIILEAKQGLEDSK